MATKKTVARPKSATKKPAGKAQKPHEVMVPVSLADLETLRRQAKAVQEDAICAAPRQVPWTWSGAHRAIEAFDRCQHMIRSIDKAIMAAGLEVVP